MNINEIRKLTKYDPVTYVPAHANGNAMHKDCEQGVFIGLAADGNSLRVLYCNGRKIQQTNPADLVIG